MSKTPFKLVVVILIYSLLISCNNSNTPKEQDSLKDQKHKFLEASAVSEPEEFVFYDLVDPKKKDQPIEAKDQEKQAINTLSPEVIEAIHANIELQERKKDALKTIAEAKRIEALLVGEDSSDNGDYTYSDDE